MGREKGAFGGGFRREGRGRDWVEKGVGVETGGLVGLRLALMWLSKYVENVVKTCLTCVEKGFSGGELPLVTFGTEAREINCRHNKHLLDCLIGGIPLSVVGGMIRTCIYGAH